MWSSTLWLALSACVPLLPSATSSTTAAPAAPSATASTDPADPQPRRSQVAPEVTFVPREHRACITCPWPQLEGWPALTPRAPTTIFANDDARGKPQLYTDGWSRTEPTFVGLTVDYAKRAAPYWGYPNVTVQPDVHFRADCHAGEVCRWAKDTPSRGHIVLFVNPEIVITVPE